MKKFTLVQLLVVIVIISILSGLFIPITSNAKNRGKTILCVSNQRQVMINVLMYALENKERLMPSGNGGFTNQHYAMFFNDSDYNNRKQKNNSIMPS